MSCRFYGVGTKPGRYLGVADDALTCANVFATGIGQYYIWPTAGDSARCTLAAAALNAKLGGTDFGCKGDGGDTYLCVPGVLPYPCREKVAALNRAQITTPPTRSPTTSRPTRSPTRAPTPTPTRSPSMRVCTPINANMTTAAWVATTTVSRAGDRSYLTGVAHADVAPDTASETASFFAAMSPPPHPPPHHHQGTGAPLTSVVRAGAWSEKIANSKY